jgi:hypothetical protein
MQPDFTPFLIGIIFGIILGYSASVATIGALW